MPLGDILPEEFRLNAVSREDEVVHEIEDVNQRWTLPGTVESLPDLIYLGKKCPMNCAKK